MCAPPRGFALCECTYSFRPLKRTDHSVLAAGAHTHTQWSMEGRRQRAFFLRQKQQPAGDPKADGSAVEKRGTVKTACTWCEKKRKVTERGESEGYWTVKGRRTLLLSDVWPPWWYLAHTNGNACKGSGEREERDEKGSRGGPKGIHIRRRPPIAIQTLAVVDQRSATIMPASRIEKHAKGPSLEEKGCGGKCEKGVKKRELVLWKHHKLAACADSAVAGPRRNGWREVSTCASPSSGKGNRLARRARWRGS